jgi:ATP-dependent DNA ligase
MKTTLYKLSKEGVMLTSVIFAEKKGEQWEIWKETGQKDGKKIEHSPDIIKEGKAKRTLDQQMELQYNSIINKLLDKGYKRTEQEAQENKGTDAAGVPKPMLAAPSKDKEESIFQNVKWKVSRKFDGVRCLIGKLNGNILALSREGKSYDVGARFVIEDLQNAGVFDRMVDGEFLDGEMYIHGRLLQTFSGLMRKQDPMEEHQELQYHVYDVLKTGPFEGRLEFLRTTLKDVMVDGRIVMVEHFDASSYDEVKELHDRFVEEGYEGAIARNVASDYLSGRDKRMVKVKAFQDAEYTIIGYKEGKRGLVDLVYVMDAGESGMFDAKPVGEEGCELKTVPDKFIGKTATIRFSSFTVAGVPSHGVLTVVRDYE